MPRLPTLVTLAALLAIPAAQAQARTVKAQPAAAIKARQSAMADFDARMSRLDALMGTPSVARTVRSRSAEAGR